MSYKAQGRVVALFSLLGAAGCSQTSMLPTGGACTVGSATSVPGLFTSPSVGYDRNCGIDAAATTMTTSPDVFVRATGLSVLAQQNPAIGEGLDRVRTTLVNPGVQNCRIDRNGAVVRLMDCFVVTAPRREDVAPATAVTAAAGSAPAPTPVAGPAQVPADMGPANGLAPVSNAPVAPPVPAPTMAIPASTRAPLPATAVPPPGLGF
jgi:hypothetical protein